MSLKFENLNKKINIDGPYKHRKQLHYVLTYKKDDYLNPERIDIYGKSDKECEIILSKHIENIKQNITNISNKKSKVGYLIKKELDYKRTINEFTSVYSEETYLKTHVYKKYKDMGIKDFCCETNAIKIRDKIINSNLQPSTINKLFCFIRQTFEHGKLIGLVTIQQDNIIHLVFKGIDNPRRDKRKDEVYWSYEQFKFFVKKLEEEGTRWAIFFRLAGETACRKNELRGLMFKHYDPIKKTITIEQQATNNLYNGRTVIKKPKTTNSNRIINLSDSANQKMSLFIKTFNFKDPNSFLFFNTKYPIGQTTISRALSYYCKKYNMPYMTMHGLRHSSSTWLLDISGFTPREVALVAQKLGHRVSTLLDTYMNIHAKSCDKITNFFDN